MKPALVALCAALVVALFACGGSGGANTDGAPEAGGPGAGSALPTQCTGACNAATPVAPTASGTGGEGNVTMYSTGASHGGACGYGSTNILSYAAIHTNVAAGDGQGPWQRGKVCGQCAEVTVLTSQGLKTTTVRIVDKCPDNHCGIDLGGTAPSAVMADGFGRYAGQWRFVACAGHPGVSDGAPTLNVKDGSNAWWSRVRVHNPATGVASITYQDTGSSAQGSFAFDATNVENAYEVPAAAVLQSSAATFLITVNYVDGTKATVQLSPAQLGAASASYPLN
ncbi:hypothetical protein B0E41_26240 [Hydrogenophaga sp. A37]|nr:hypothetical protein B0E41_26240 [Hydrogenophaga sp. A37]